MTANPTDTADQDTAQVIAWRRWLHQHPELSFQEHSTARYVEDQLRFFPNLAVSRPTPTSVLAVLKGAAGPGRTVLLRADMDALPIHEDTGLAFASETPGVMHACGHDGHTAMLLGAVRDLSTQPETLRGEVRFIFQHAEELFPGGARELVDAGLLGGVDVAVGIHLMSPVPAGVVVLRDGPLLAAPDMFDLTIHGRGGHAAFPHTTIDPVVIAAQVILALQSVISRQRDPVQPAVLSVTTLNAGTAHNVIPGEVKLGGSVRTFDPELRRAMPERMERVARGITDAYGATCTFTYTQGYDAVYNDPAVTQVLREVAAESLPELTLHPGEPLMGGEDFSAYLGRVPGAFILLGAGGPGAAPHHHPKFDIDESALVSGTRMYAAAARRLTQPV